MNTYMIQAILGEQFEDIYVEADTVEAALAAAPALSTLYRDAAHQRTWVRFVA